MAFSGFDVALLTGLPVTRKVIQLDGDEVMIEVRQMVRGQMVEWEKEEMGGREPQRFRKK